MTIVEADLCLRCTAGIVALTVLRLGFEMGLARRHSAVKLPGKAWIDWTLAILGFLGVLSSFLGGLGAAWIYGGLFAIFGYRNAAARHSRQAGDTMILTVLAAVFVGMLGDFVTVTICLWFIAAQAALAYFNNGLAKLRSPKWRAGNYLFELFSYSRFQNPTLARCLRPGKPGQVAAWLVMGFEILFPVALVSGSPTVFLFLGFGILFHLFVTLSIGIGTFSLAFLSTYPAVYFCSVQVQTWLAAH